METATAIAAHTALSSWGLQRYEPVGWAEELLPAATAADVAQLPRLYAAATLCAQTGRPEEAVGYAQVAVALEPDPRYDPFENGLAQSLEATGHIYAGRIDRFLEIGIAQAAKSGLAGLVGRCAMAYALPAVGRAAEARAIAPDTLASARARGNPWMVAYAINAFGQAFADTDPGRVLDVYREGLRYTRQHRLPLWEAVIARDAAGLEAAHGTLDQGLALFDIAIDSCHQSGNIGNLAVTLANLALFFDRHGQPETAATLYGTTTLYTSTVMVTDWPERIEQLRTALGESRFDECAAVGAAMELADAVRYARHQIEVTLRQLGDPG